MWPTVRDKVRALRRPTDVMLDGATVRAVEGDVLVLSHPAVPLAKRLNEDRNVEVIREALRDALGVNWRVRCEPGDAAPARTETRRSAGPAAPEPPPVDERAEEESMLAEAAAEDATTGPRRDPEEVALELLQNELGARKIEG